MWMTNTKAMCNAHLLGEHVELHMFIGAMKKGIRMNGYLNENMLEPMAMAARHEEIAAEMVRRGFDHKSPITEADIMAALNSLNPYQRLATIDRKAAKEELVWRCPLCAEGLTDD